MRRSNGKSEQQVEGTRQRILDAALDVFARKGYHGAIVDDIVEASDTSKGSFYFHFPNKHGAFLALVDLLADRLETKVAQAIAKETESVARVDAALSTFLSVFSRHRRLAKILLIDVFGLGHSFDKKYLQIRARFTQLIEQHLNEAVTDGSIGPIDTRLTAVAWVGAVNEIVVHWLYTGQPKPLTAVLPQLRRLLLASIGIDRRVPHPETVQENV